MTMLLPITLFGFGGALACQLLLVPSGRLVVRHDASNLPPGERWSRLCQHVGRRVRRLGRLRADQSRDRTTGQIVIVSTSFAFLHPGIAVVVALLLWSGDIAARRRRSAQQDRERRAGLAEVIDLYAVTLTTGHNLAAATQEVARWTDGELGETFGRSLRLAAGGRPLAEMLALIPERLGPEAQPLIAALVAHDRFGAPIGARLSQLAIDSRADRRRRAEVDARRLPVKLLFPLVVCVLPAFLLLTVVPAVADALAGIALFASPA